MQRFKIVLGQILPRQLALKFMEGVVPLQGLFIDGLVRWQVHLLQ